jgi:hypothetical protein
MQVSGRRAHSDGSARPASIPDLEHGRGKDTRARFQPSEGVYLYEIDLVVVVTHPGRCWFGFTLAMVPLVIGPFGRAFGGRTWRDA